jgi:hypothetical protein
MGPPDPERGDAHLHELFAGLRTQVADVMHEFSTRVMKRVDAAGAPRRTPLGELLAQILVEVSNLVSTGSEDPDDGQDDDGPDYRGESEDDP